MGLFSFGKKKEPEEYYPDSPDRAFDEWADNVEMNGNVMVYMHKLFRNNLFAIDKIQELNAKIDKLENLLLKQNQELQQKLGTELEYTERHK